MLKAIFSITLFALTLAGCDRKQAAPVEAKPRAEAGAAPTPQRAEHRQETVGQQAPLRQGLLLKDNYSSLVARARNGDARAACQLATELDFCAGSVENARYLLDAQERTSKLDPSVLGKDSALATISEVARMRSEYCRDVPQATPSERINYWRLAAQRGHLPSVLHYASGRAFLPSEMLSLLDDLKVYRTDALPMMQRAAANGSYQAALMLARAYENVSPPDAPPLLKQVVGKGDSARSLGYYMLAEQLANERRNLTASETTRLHNDVKRLREQLPAEQVAAAQTYLQELSAGREATQAGQELIEQTPYTPIPGTSSCEEQSTVR